VSTPPAPARKLGTTASGQATGAASTPLTAAAVLGLQGYRAYPSVSLLLTTTPGERLDSRGRAGLDALVREAHRRLLTVDAVIIRDVVHGLDALAAEIDGPVDRALGLFASAVHTARFDLPVEVVDRCVIDPTFATRDLVRALHRTPRHVVLLLAADEARLLDAPGGRLTPVTHGFPRTDPAHRRGEPARDRFLGEVDQSLGAYLRLHPAPLVIAAAEPTLGAFRQLSRNTTRLAGTLPGNHLATPPEELHTRIRPVIEAYLLSRQAEALTLLTERVGQGRAVHGIERAWLASRWERPEMLAVEQGYFQPARLSPDGDTLTLAVKPVEAEAPDVLDDAVDELIEAVLARGGWVALLADHTLPADARVALTLRP
jgi:Bacterial archaeo-eukaryotic release factor family 3